MSEPVRGGGVCAAPEIIGQSAALLRAVGLARRFAPSNLPVLLVGATGTGKELFAHAIHAWSGCRGEFVDVNCGALPRDLVEGLLFGHGRGAFTGAVEAVQGIIEAADGGTLFLDELCSLSLEGQAKLLRALENGEIRRVGETRKRRSRFRLIAAAHEGLREQLTSGAFRLDLYHRAAGVVITLPRLAERREDIGPLARRFAAEVGLELEETMVAALREGAWPGNVRELRAVVQRAALLSDGVFGLDHIVDAMAMSVPVGVGVSADRAADRHLLDACRASGGDSARAAASLGVSRATLFRRLKQLGVTYRGVADSRSTSLV